MGSLPMLAFFPMVLSPAKTLPVPAAEESRSPALEREIGAERGLVCAVIARMLRERRDHPDVEDVASECLRRAIENASSRKGPLRPWLLGIARHVTLDRIRFRRRERARFEQTPPTADESAPNAIDRAAADVTPADEAIEARERAESLRAALARLPEGQRRALELFHLESLDYQEISKRLNVPLGTVATWILRGRRTLADTLGKGETS